jgi:protoporphyrinogen oxidase
MSAIDLLRSNGVTTRFIEWFWATACLSVMNVPLERCSAGSLMRIIARLFGRRDYRIGFPDVGLAELFVPASETIIAAARGRISVLSPVKYIAFDGKRVCGVHLDDGTLVRAKHVVAAVPPHELHALLPNALRAHAPLDALLEFEPSPYVSTYLWFDRKITREKFWARVWKRDALNTDFYDLSNIREGRQLCSSVLASNSIYAHQATAYSDEEIIRRTLLELREALPQAREARVTRAVVNRIPMAIPCPLPGMERRRPTTITDNDGLLLAGDWTRTGLPFCMEGAVRSGFAAAEILWRAIGRERKLVRSLEPLQGFARLSTA